MQFLEYEKYKVKYNGLKWRYTQLLLEKERLFTKTLPNAIRYDKDQVQTSVDSNILEDYVVSLEEKKLDLKLTRLGRCIKDWTMLLDLKEKELRRSKSVYDRMYVLKYIDGEKASKIAELTEYSKAQTYKILRQIDKRRDQMRIDMWYD